jgi:hypothetical protein
MDYYYLLCRTATPVVISNMRIGNFVDEQRELIEMLVARLERLSADSYWAHQASGVRGSLLRILETDNSDSSQAAILLERGFDYLEKAAREI